jgi:hypothetical protein
VLIGCGQSLKVATPTTAHSCTTQQIDALADAAVDRLYHDTIRAYADSIRRVPELGEPKVFTNR